MADIYDLYDAAFKAVTAAVVLKDGARVATIALKRGGAVTAYVHWFGLSMVKGRAGGGGYDRASAACGDAARKLLKSKEDLSQDCKDFITAIVNCGGNDWRRALEDSGFVVLFAIP